MPNRAKSCLVATVAVAFTALGIAGCGTPSTDVTPRAGAGTVPPAPPDTVLHLQNSAGIETLHVKGGRWTASGGVATPDWSTVFTVTAGRLRTLDGVSGAQRAVQSIAPELHPTVSSADGRFVALTDSPSRLGQGVMPPGRSRSTIIVAPADPAVARTRTLSLDGNVLPEGFSTDNTRLFVIDFLPPLHPNRYRVRAVDIASGQIGPVYTFDKSVDTEEMQGLSRTQVFSSAAPLGAMLYTLYIRADRTASYADVHALSLEGGLVHCTDLPASLHITPTGGAIAVSPDGQHIFVAGATGTVAEIDASGTYPFPAVFPIVHTVQVAAESGTTSVTLAADNHTVWVGLGRRIVGLDNADLHTVAASTVGEPIHALAVDPTGTLYAATINAVESVRADTGAVHLVANTDTTPVRLAAL